ncbi:MAG: extracellular solute-binding protein [Bacilli bacterium]|jgi:N-acetylglucosamine transport system substrate-binding protein
MKPNYSFLMLGAVSLLSASVLSSCHKVVNDEHTLNVVCLNAGYGREWIDAAVAIWERDNPDYRVNLNATADAKTVIQSNIFKAGNIDDVYISVGADWKKYAGGDRLLALDDLLQETVDGVKVIDKINDEYQGSIHYQNRHGETHTYRLPWTSGLGGIFYNAVMFAENGWNVPTTYDQLLTLCQTIIEANIYVDPSDPTEGRVYPFTFTGNNSDYFDYTVFTWWSQLAGKEAIDQFLQYDQADYFDAEINPTYAKLKTATMMWSRLFGPDSTFGDKLYDPADKNRGNHEAQKNFKAGKAAMMFNGDWIYNEMLKYSSDNTLPANFSVKLMNTPLAPGALEDAKKTAYIIGEDQYIAIPASTIKADLAKSFIKTLISDQVLKIFNEQAHGLMAYKLSDGSIYQTSDVFVNSLIDYRTNLETTFTNYSTSPLFLNGLVDIWGTSKLRPFQSLNNGGSKSVDASFLSIKNEVARQWSSWTKLAGINE